MRVLLYERINIILECHQDSKMELINWIKKLTK